LSGFIQVLALPISKLIVVKPRGEYAENLFTAKGDESAKFVR